MLKPGPSHLKSDAASIWWRLEETKDCPVPLPPPLQNKWPVCYRSVVIQDNQRIHGDRLIIQYFHRVDVNLANLLQFHPDISNGN